ncbi:uncharacterized protein LOC109101856 [Cyprinus carpio]|uniref:Uncharacterized protein LOC109101856 n=1 Tax=Cyprinus carpio TaxID=7962 RepID=A0A9R0B8L0_CYPCA|nr:uncharacterized protein LOC109101856 [Cyprinus carpio]
MTSTIILRVILGENSAQKVTLQNGVLCSLAELMNEIQTQCNLMGEFRLQIMDPDLQDFVNLTSTTDVQNKSTLKVIKLCDSFAVSPSPSSCDTDILSSRSSSEVSHSSSLDPQELTLNTRSSWPTCFVVPRFSYEAEIKLEQGNSEYQKNGILLNPDPKLKSDILDGLAEEIVKFKVYLSDAEFSEVAEALIKQHPCLKEQGSLTGCSGWKRSLKYKMSNYRTKLRNLGCSEVTVNAMKHKPMGVSNPAFGVKKPRKAEVNFCPSFLPGETPDSMEQIRVSLLSEVKKKNNEQTLRRLMDLSFALRRQEVVKESPLIVDFMGLCMFLFQECELFLLDEHTPSLLRIFAKRGGAQGQRIRKLLVPLTQCACINVKRECFLKALFVYLNEDPDNLIKEYMDVDFSNAETAFKEMVMGVFVIRCDGGEGCEGCEDEPADVGVVLEGVTALEGLGNVTNGVALLIGLIYALNLSYPKELRYTFELLQKVFLELDGHKLSTKVQALKTKLFTP